MKICAAQTRPIKGDVENNIAQNAFKQGAKVYIASVAKSATGYEKSGEILSKIAAEKLLVV